MSDSPELIRLRTARRWFAICLGAIAIPVVAWLIIAMSTGSSATVSFAAVAVLGTAGTGGFAAFSARMRETRHRDE